MYTSHPTIHRDSVNKVNVDKMFSNQFEMQVGVHQRSIFSSILFIMRELLKIGRLWELLYSYDNLLIAASCVESEKRFCVWVGQLELKVLRVNLAKTKAL